MTGSALWFVTFLLLVIHQCEGQSVERENGDPLSSDFGLEKRYINQGRTSVVEQMMSLLQNLRKGKFRVKRRRSLHDSLKNLYIKHFSRYLRNAPPPPDFEEYQDDSVAYY